MSIENLAAVLESKHGSIVTRVRPKPIPGPGEILVANKAVAGNPVEWMVRDYGFAITSYPTVLGSDVCGIIESIGQGVTKFRPGDRVLGYAAVLNTSNPDNGSWQTFTILKETAATRIPDHLTFEEGSSLPLAFATTINAYFMQLGLSRPVNSESTIEEAQGHAILIWGGGGSVAAAMIQLGKALGFVVYTTASLRHSDRLRKIGATEIFDYNDSNVVQSILDKAKTDHLVVSHAIDVVSQKESLEKSCEVLVGSGGPSSKIVSLLDWPADLPCPVQKSKTVAFTTFDTEQGDLSEWFYNDWLAEALSKGVVVPSPPVQIVPGGLSSATMVLDSLKAGVNGVKLVVQI